VFGLGSWSDGRQILDAYNRVTDLLEKDTYTDANKNRIIELLTELGLENSDTGHGLVLLRQNRGRLVRRPASGMEIVADGRGDWIGWLELKREAVDEEAIRNTARVIANVNADIIGVVEADDRPSLVRFNDDVLKPTTNRRYESIMLIDGNDSRTAECSAARLRVDQLPGRCSGQAHRLPSCSRLRRSRRGGSPP
jgi:hypothetical protein